MLDGVQRVLEADRLPFQNNLTLGRLQKAEQHLHQGGFAGAVFSQQRVNGSSLAGQAHIPIGGKAVGINHGDVIHL